MTTVTRPPRRRPHGQRLQAGFGLTEVLMAVLVAALAMLGLAQLQTLTLRSNTSAYHRSIATLLAGDLADRIRANPAGLGDGAYEAGGRDPGAGNTHPDCFSTTPGDTPRSCSPADLAEHDLRRWSDSIQELLPPLDDGPAEGMICRASSPESSSWPDCDGGELFVIAIRWDDRIWSTPEDRSTSDPTVFTLAFRP